MKTRTSGERTRVEIQPESKLLKFAGKLFGAGLIIAFAVILILWWKSTGLEVRPGVKSFFSSVEKAIGCGGQK